MINTLIKKNNISATVIISYITVVISFVSNIIIIVLINKLFGSDTYGKFMLIYATLSFSNDFFSFRSVDAVVRFIKEYLELNQIDIIPQTLLINWIFDFILSLTFFSFFILFSPIIATHLLKDSYLISHVITFSFYSIFNTLKNTQLGFFNAINSINIINLLKIIESLVKVVLVLFIIILNQKSLYSIITVYVFTSIITLLISLMFFYVKINNLSIKEESSFSKIIFSRYLKFISKNFVAGTLKSMTRKADDIILGYFTTPLQVGHLNILKQLIVPFNYLLQPVDMIYFPKMIKFYISNKFSIMVNNMRQISKKLLIIFLAIYFPFLFGLEFIIKFITDDKIANIHIIFTLLLISSSYYSYYWFGKSLSNLINPLISIYANFIVIILMILLAIPLIIYYEILGVGIFLVLQSIILAVFWEFIIYKFEKKYENSLPK